MKTAASFSPMGVEFKMIDLDDSTIRETVPGNTYEPAVTALLHRLFAEGGGVFYDVGALYGYFALFVGAASPTTAIMAFEPNERSALVLERNAALNGLSMGVSRAALADESRTQAFRGKTLLRETAKRSNWDVDPDADRAFAEVNVPGSDIATGGAPASSNVVGLPRWILSSVKDLARSISKPEPDRAVECARFDDMDRPAAERPVIMKMDVHGGEVLALRGMERFLREEMDLLFLEMHRDDMLVGGTHDETVDRLLDADLELFEIVNFRSDVKWAVERLNSQAIDRLRSSSKWDLGDRTLMKMIIAKKKGYADDRLHR